MVGLGIIFGSDVLIRSDTRSQIEFQESQHNMQIEIVSMDIIQLPRNSKEGLLLRLMATLWAFVGDTYHVNCSGSPIDGIKLLLLLSFIVNNRSWP